MPLRGKFNQYKLESEGSMAEMGKILVNVYSFLLLCLQITRVPGLCVSVPPWLVFLLSLVKTHLESLPSHSIIFLRQDLSLAG